MDPLISVVIVNYRVPEYACRALQSLREAENHDQTEVIVVDNASGDRSRETISREFPNAKWIELKNNIGFGKACNVGARHAGGRYLLLLNPDTLLSRDTLRVCTEFMEQHPRVGVLGPGIINPDGSLQKSCRRGFPTPFNAFSHVMGLDRLFPRNRVFGKYNLTYMDADKASRVDAISGSFMFFRASTFKEIGGFDESFFMYGEDLDICARVSDYGQEVWYLPDTQIVHFRGRSTAKRAIRSRSAFYEAMLLFSRKYRHSYGAFFPGWLLTLGIVVQAAFDIGATLAKSLTACFIDLSIMNTLLWATIMIRFHHAGLGNPYGDGGVLTMAAMHAFMSGSFLLVYAVRGIYSAERYSPRNAIASGIVASLIFLTGVYLVPVMALSRIAFVVSSVLTAPALVAWRQYLPLVARQVKRRVFSTGRVVILGHGKIASILIKHMEQDTTAEICGVVWPGSDNMPGDFEGYPVLGAMNQIGPILRKRRAQLLLIATAENWYSHIIEALAQEHLSSLTIRWVPRELFECPSHDLPDKIPLNDFSV